MNLGVVCSQSKELCWKGEGWTTKFLFSLGLAVNENLQRIICLACQTSRKLDQVESHLAETHKDTISKTQQEAALKILMKHGVSKTPNDPTTLVDKPVPSVLVRPGKRCPFANCTQLFGATSKNLAKNFRRHWTLQHKTSGDSPAPSTLKNCYVQRLDPWSPLLRCPPPDHEHEILKLASTWSANLPEPEKLPVEVSNDRGFPPHLLCQAFPQFLGRYVLEKKYMKKLSEALALPRSGDPYERLESIVRRFYTDVSVSADAKDWIVRRIFGGADT